MKDRVTSIMNKMSTTVTAHYNKVKAEASKFKEDPKAQFQNLLSSNATAKEMYDRLSESSVMKQYEDIKSQYEQVKSMCQDDPEKMAEEYLNSGQSFKEQYDQIANMSSQIPNLENMIDIPEFQDLNFPDYENMDLPDFSGTGLQNLMGM